MKRLLLALLLLAACDDPGAYIGPPSTIEGCSGECSGWWGRCYPQPSGAVFWCECMEVGEDDFVMAPAVCCLGEPGATCNDDTGCGCPPADHFADVRNMVDDTGTATVDGDHFEDELDMVEAEGKPSCLELCPDIPVHCGCFIRLGLCWAACR